MKLTSLYLSIILLLPIFVYNLKEISRVHVMKFTGSFSVVYQDIKLLNEDLSFTESSTLENAYPQLEDYFIRFINFFYTNPIIFGISYLNPSPRAPPFLFNH